MNVEMLRPDPRERRNLEENKNDELRQMIADYMAKGYLENIIDMFKYDKSLYSMVGDLLRDDRIRVRIGIAAQIGRASCRERV